MSQITKDPAYDAVDPKDFPAMMDVERYGRRSTAFDKIISATHDHFWDPLDKKYIDFTEAFDQSQHMMLPEDFFPIFATKLGDSMGKEQRLLFARESSRWQLSAILHGEQGALALSASLCHILKDPGAQEYAANQTREEARHVTAFAAYIKARWGTPLPCGETLKTLLTEMVLAQEVYKKIVGMQMQMFAYAAWLEAHDLRQQRFKLACVNLSRVVQVDVDRQRVRDTDGIGELDGAALRKAGGNDIFCQIARRIGGGTVDLGGILARESAAAMRGCATIGVDNDLAAGQSAVAVRSTHHEGTGGIDVPDRILGDEVAWQRFAHIRLDDGPHVRRGHFGIQMLGRDHDLGGMHRLVVDIMQSHLAFGVRSQSRLAATFAGVG